MRYIDSDTIREAAEAYRQHVPIDQIAGRLGITVAELRVALNLPAAPTQNMVAEPSTDLWRVDHDVL